MSRTSKIYLGKESYTFFYVLTNGIEHVKGQFEMVNPISEKFQEALRKDCVADAAFREFTEKGGAE